MAFQTRLSFGDLRARFGRRDELRQFQLVEEGGALAAVAVSGGRLRAGALEVATLLVVDATNLRRIESMVRIKTIQPQGFFGFFFG